MHSPQRVILDKAPVLKGLPLFSDLSLNQINFIARHSEFYEYKKDEQIYNEGDSPDAFYCLVSGRVRLFTKDKFGQATTLEYLHRGSYFGILSLLTGEPHSVSAQVINDIVVLKILKEDFHKLLREIPKLAIQFSSALSRRLKRKDLGQKTVFESTIISIYGVRPMIGRTLYALNLAKALTSQTKKDALFVDMAYSDEEGVSKFLEIKEGLIPLEFMTVFFDEIKVRNSILRHESGISILRIPYVARTKPHKTQIIPLLSYLTNLFDYCIVDLPSKIDESVLTVLAQSDLLHIITDNKIENLNATTNFIQELSNNIREPQEKIKIIINEINGRLQDQHAGLLRYKIYATLPDLKGNEHEYNLAVRRIARQIGEVLVGLALGSGAALGLSQIGIIKVLEREAIPIDVVAGSSMGALIGAFWAVGLTGVDMERLAIENKKRLGIFTLKDLKFPVRGLLSDAKTLYFLRQYLGTKTFRDIRFPLKIVATTVEDRKDVIIDSGELVSAVRASISIPGIYSPVRKDGRFLIDGGIIDPVPVSVLLKMKVKRIIAVNTLPSSEDVERTLLLERERVAKEEAQLKEKNALARFLFRLRRRITDYFTLNILDIIVNSIQALEYSMAEASLRQADVAIHPNLAGCFWRDFLSPEKLISLGEEACEKALPEIKRLIMEE